MPKLILMKGPARTKQVALFAGETTIGRAATNDVALDSMQVSRRHAVVTMDGPFATIHDLGSRNGVYVNGARVQSFVLASGDEVSIGTFKIRFLSDDDDSCAVDAMRLMTTPELLADLDRSRETSLARV
ncbi:FHA domain-containing protein [Variovorax sp. M-6]|uniref:FHA domain-containing protein n=1 Tax=Variovorax sp. M-6 TaxID=3233041 RepID=UPI003F9A0061